MNINNYFAFTVTATNWLMRERERTQTEKQQQIASMCLEQGNLSFLFVIRCIMTVTTVDVSRGIKFTLCIFLFHYHWLRGVSFRSANEDVHLARLDRDTSPSLSHYQW